MSTTTKKSKPTTSVIVDEKFVDIDTHEVLTTTKDVIIVTPFDEDVTERLTNLIEQEIKDIEAEIAILKTTIKSKQGRIKELTKQPSRKGPSKKDEALKIYKLFPAMTLLEFVTDACTQLNISPVYASTLYKEFQKIG